MTANYAFEADAARLRTVSCYRRCPRGQRGVNATGLKTSLRRCDLGAELPHLAESGLSRP